MQYPTNWIRNDKLSEFVESALQANDPFAWLFVGDAGCGKTALSELVFKELCGKHKPNWFKTANYLYNQYVAMCGGNDAEKSRQIAMLNNSLTQPLFVLDDLGREINSEASSVWFANLFSEQYEAFKEGKVQRCIVTTNLHSDQIAKRYGSHVMDRMFEVYTIVKFSNGSFRAMKKRVVEI